MAVACGIDIGGTKVLSVAVAPDGTLLTGGARQPTPQGTDALLDGLVDVVRTIERQHGPVDSIGLGIAGLVDRTGRFAYGPHLRGVVDVDVGAALADRVGVPVAVDNDATCATLAELLHGAGVGAQELAFVSLGTGIGGGVVVGGELRHGANGFAGEPGHMVVDVDGPPCPCGRRGCWERYASGSGLTRMAREAVEAGRATRVLELAGGDPELVRGEHVTLAARDGDDGALAVFAQLGWWTALGIATLVSILDVEVVVIGGGLIETGSLLLDPVRLAFAELAFAGPHRPPVRIEAAHFGETAGAYGAALLAAPWRRQGEQGD